MRWKLILTLIFTGIPGSLWADIMIPARINPAVYASSIPAAAAGGGEAEFPQAARLVWGFTFDDGAGSLVDHSTNSNNLTANNGAGFNTGNDGINCDGVDDDFTGSFPTGFEWQSGFTMAILSTIPATQNGRILYADASGNAAHRLFASGNASSAFNRMEVRAGRQFNNGALYLPQDGVAGDSTKVWRIAIFDGTNNEAGNAKFYKGEDQATTVATAQVETFGTTALNRISLCRDTSAGGPIGGTIYRAYIWNVQLTQTEREAVVAGATP